MNGRHDPDGTETEGAGHLCVTSRTPLLRLAIDLGGEGCCPLSIGLLTLTALSPG